MDERRVMSFFIVDDDENIIELMTVLLEGAGHKVLSDTVGAMAISEIVRAKPQCVITDLMMASLDGLELCRELRSRSDLSDMKIIFVSARGDDYWKKRASDAGADGYIVKPVKAGSFVDQVEAIVAGNAD